MGGAAADLTPPAALRPPTPQQHHPEPARTGRHLDATGSSPDTPPPAASDAAPASGSRTADKSTEEQQPRVQLTGRLGRDPSFRTSLRGTLGGSFSLAVHREDGTTVWHSIVAFGSQAEQLQHRTEAGELAKGRKVNLVGYQHTRQKPTRDGHTKTVTEIYAVAVTRR